MTTPGQHAVWLYIYTEFCTFPFSDPVIVPSETPPVTRLCPSIALARWLLVTFIFNKRSTAPRQIYFAAAAAILAIPNCDSRRSCAHPSEVNWGPSDSNHGKKMVCTFGVCQTNDFSEVQVQDTTAKVNSSLVKEDIYTETNHT